MLPDSRLPNIDRKNIEAIQRPHGPDGYDEFAPLGGVDPLPDVRCRSLNGRSA
jgi:hypothetical protein